MARNWQNDDDDAILFRSLFLDDDDDGMPCVSPYPLTSLQNKTWLLDKVDCPLLRVSPSLGDFRLPMRDQL